MFPRVIDMKVNATYPNDMPRYKCELALKWCCPHTDPFFNSGTIATAYHYIRYQKKRVVSVLPNIYIYYIYFLNSKCGISALIFFLLYCLLHILFILRTLQTNDYDTIKSHMRLSRIGFA